VPVPVFVPLLLLLVLPLLFTPSFALPPLFTPPRVKSTLPSIEDTALDFHDDLELVIDVLVVDVSIDGANSIFSFYAICAFLVSSFLLLLVLLVLLLLLFLLLEARPLLARVVLSPS
jgi:hypothetical protein